MNKLSIMMDPSRVAEKAGLLGGILGNSHGEHGDQPINSFHTVDWYLVGVVHTL